MRTVDPQSSYQQAYYYVKENPTMPTKQIMKHLKFVIGIKPKTATFYLCKIRKELKSIGTSA